MNKSYIFAKKLLTLLVKQLKDQVWIMREIITKFISKSHKFNKDNFLVNFEINDRANNHKNLFEWKYLYINDSNLRKLKEKLSNAIHFFENGYSDGIANEDDYLEV